MSTAIVGLMAPAKVSGTFPWIIRGSWEVQVYLVREPPRIGLKGVYFTRSAAGGWGTGGGAVPPCLLVVINITFIYINYCLVRMPLCSCVINTQ